MAIMVLIIIITITILQYYCYYYRVVFYYMNCIYRRRYVVWYTGWARLLTCVCIEESEGCGDGVCTSDGGVVWGFREKVVGIVSVCVCVCVCVCVRGCVFL